jgi:hypothetical protein
MRVVGTQPNVRRVFELTDTALLLYVDDDGIQEQRVVQSKPPFQCDEWRHRAASIPCVFGAFGGHGRRRDRFSRKWRIEESERTEAKAR